MTERMLGTSDFIRILGCGKSFANDLMHMFDARAQMYRVGRQMKVKEKVFQDWLERECKGGKKNDR